MVYAPSEERYHSVPCRQCGQSAVTLPPISLGLWQNFGVSTFFETDRALILRVFGRGVTHFDLANMYGPPYRSAEENFGKVLKLDFHRLLEELVITAVSEAPLAALEA